MSSDKEDIINRGLHMKARKAVGTRILRYRTDIAYTAVAYRINQDGTLQSKVESFRKDIINVPYHYFGEHHPV